jgi:hypothetical protein
MAATAVKGGHFRFVAKLGPTVEDFEQVLSVNLFVANDGLSLSYPSTVDWTLVCGPGDSGVVESGPEVMFDWAYPFRPVLIGADGRFAFRGQPYPGSTGLILIEGRFERAGDVAVGRLAIGGNPKCQPIRRTFRARLVGRPNAPHRGRRSLCDRVTVGYPIPDVDEAYRVYDRGIGCTTAREIARQWHASLSCQHLTTGAACGLHGASCTAVNGGLFNRLVSARCSARGHPHGITEFVHYRPCRPPKVSNAEISVWAINLDCHTATTFPVQALRGDPDATTGQPCGDFADYIHGRGNACAPVAGFVCRARGGGLAFDPDGGWHARCVQQSNGFRAFEFDYVNNYG